MLIFYGNCGLKYFRITETEPKLWFPNINQNSRFRRGHAFCSLPRTRRGNPHRAWRGSEVPTALAPHLRRHLLEQGHQLGHSSVLQGGHSQPHTRPQVCRGEGTEPTRDPLSPRLWQKLVCKQEIFF